MSLLPSTTWFTWSMPSTALGADAGDVYYIRSTDSGVTFGAPFKLNTDTATRPQWQPNISVSPSGTLLATWYDARDSASCTKGNPAVPCYRMWSRKSTDNGATWLADDTLSDVVSPLPGQPDGNVQATYAGDYDYGSALARKHVTSWTDGRVTISGQSQQDAFTDRELVGFSVTSTSPACGSIISTQPTDFVVNLTDPVNPASVQATDFTVNGAPANSFTLGNGNTQITFHLQQLAGDNPRPADDADPGRRLEPCFGQYAESGFHLHVPLRRSAAAGGFDCPAGWRDVLAAGAERLRLRREFQRAG